MKEYPKAIKDLEKLLSDLKRDHDLYEERKDNPDFDEWREARNRLTFQEGKKLWLEVEVKDRESFEALYYMLYNKDENQVRVCPLGCQLEVIHFIAPGADELKQKMNTLINSYNQ